MFIVDGHLDLAYNALKHGRDLRRTVAEARAAERGQTGDKGTITTTLPELRRGGVGLVFGTLFAAPADPPFAVRDLRMTYRTQEEAHRLAMAQLDYYHRAAEEVDYVRLVTDLKSLEEVVGSHEGKDDDGRRMEEDEERMEDEGGRTKEEAEEGALQLSPVGPRPLLGIVPLMEGAGPIREPEEAEDWYGHGLRMVGPAWDDTRYSPGAWRAGGPLTKDGRRLLEVLAEFGFILDLTHMSEMASLEALDVYEGVVVATHSNARALVPGERQWSDTQIRRLAERDGVVGIVLFNRFLKAGYVKGKARESVTLEVVAAHVDHVCQVVGDAAHVGIGSDLDGGFGREDVPLEMDGAADLGLIGGKLAERGYGAAEVAGIMGGNWLRVVRRAWGG